METVTQDTVLRAAFKCQGALLSYAYTVLRDWSLAQDAVQEALIAANRQWQEFRAGAEMFPWLKKIVRHKAIDIIRRRKRAAYVGDDRLLSLVDAQFERQFDTDAAADAMENRRVALQACMEKLDPASLKLLMGFYRDRQSGEELATAFRKSVNAVRLSISRLRKTLKDCVEKQLGTVEHA
ncbi:MAG: sigma-70 family RNA polymerase sigma factor [bacterium]